MNIIYYCRHKSLVFFVGRRRSRDGLVVAFITSVPITINFVSRNSAHVYSIQHYVIQFLSDLRQVDDFLRVLRFPPPIKLTNTILLIAEILSESGVKHHSSPYPRFVLLFYSLLMCFLVFAEFLYYFL